VNLFLLGKFNAQKYNSYFSNCFGMLYVNILGGNYKQNVVTSRDSALFT